MPERQQHRHEAAFRDALNSQVPDPADAFYGRRRIGKAKQPYCFEVNEGELFAFAGIWDRCFTVRIPMRGGCDSINAAVAAGLLLFEMSSQQQGSQQARCPEIIRP
jgi:putative SOS response-associated peptidase YedK